jgi:hypothetical protein
MKVTKTTIKKITLMSLLLLVATHAFAADDPLAGTDASLIATLGASGTGRKFIYLIEGVTAIATYIKTKNLMMFSGVVAIAVFMNILFKVAGVAG